MLGERAAYEITTGTGMNGQPVYGVSTVCIRPDGSTVRGRQAMGTAGLFQTERAAIELARSLRRAIEKGEDVFADH